MPWALIFYILAVVLFIYTMLCGPTKFHRNGVIGWLYRMINRAPDVIGTCLCTTLCCGKKRGNDMMDKCAVCLCETRNPIMQFVYVFLIGGAVYMFFWQCYPLIPKYTIHRTGAPLAVIFAFGSYAVACLADPGKITEKTYKMYSDVYQYDGIFFVEGRDCSTCKRPKPARSKHCRACGHCIARFDHHCAWINHCVGANNYRWFLLFVLSHAWLTGYGFYLCCQIVWRIMLKEKLWNATFVLSDGTKIPSSWTILFHYFITRHGLVLAEALFLICICIMMVGFFGYHAWLVCKNQTINESFKWSEFEEGMAMEGLTEQYQQVPNIWNNGVWQNWLEIIFPYHLRASPPNSGKKIEHKKGTKAGKGKQK